MRINVHAIPEDGLDLEEDLDPALLDLKPEDMATPEGPIHCSFSVLKNGSEVLVRGSAVLPVCLECVRCGAFFSTTVGDSAFLRDYLLAEEQQELDLSEDIREAVLLGLPLHPLCGPDCGGLCPQCGKPRKAGPCGCKEPKVPGPWDGLDSLKI